MYIPDHSGRVTFRPGRQKNTGSLIFLEQVETRMLQYVSNAAKDMSSNKTPH